jgi:hypothetical protein
MEEIRRSGNELLDGLDDVISAFYCGNADTQMKAQKESQQFRRKEDSAGATGWKEALKHYQPFEWWRFSLSSSNCNRCFVG